MRRRRTAYAALMILGAGLIVSGCQDNRVAGGGTETGNADVVAGRVTDAGGKGRANAEVRLCEVKPNAAGTDSGLSFAATTDSAGNYRFTAVKPGHYALYAPGSGASPATAILTRLEKTDTALEAADMIAAGAVTLVGRVLPTVEGRIEDVRVCVGGLHACVQPGMDSVYRIDKAPKGSYELIFLSRTAAQYLGLTIRSGAGERVYLRDVALKDSADAGHLPYRFYDLAESNSYSTVPVAYPANREPAWYVGKTLEDAAYFFLLPKAQTRPWNPDFFAAWPYAKVLAGDSLVAAPDLAVPLTGFALPVHLSAPGFDFAQAQPDGSDLVFSDGQGRLLSHEIEQWDPVAGRAVIWVRLDSLAAAKADRKVAAHWGHAYPAAYSDGSAVFRKQNGYLAAWHLTESGPDGKVHEARGAFPGTLALGAYAVGAVPGVFPAAGSGLLEALDGPVAKGFQMGTTGAYVHVPYQAQLDVSAAFTVSVWARVSAADSAHKQVFASKWQLGRREWHFDLQPNRTFELEFGDSLGIIQGTWRSLVPVTGPDKWHHYAATFANGAVHLYLDGVEVAGAGATGSVPSVIHHFKADLNIGSNSIDMPLNWAGDLDELELYSEAKNRDWLDMVFRSQKPEF